MAVASKTAGALVIVAVILHVEICFLFSLSHSSSVLIYIYVLLVLGCQLDMPDDHLCENFQKLIDTASALKSKALSKCQLNFIHIELYLVLFH